MVTSKSGGRRYTSLKIFSVWATASLILSYGMLSWKEIASFVAASLATPDSSLMRLSNSFWVKPWMGMSITISLEEGSNANWTIFSLPGEKNYCIKVPFTSIKCILMGGPKNVRHFLSLRGDKLLH